MTIPAPHPLSTAPETWRSNQYVGRSHMAKAAALAKASDQVRRSWRVVEYIITHQPITETDRGYLTILGPGRPHIGMTKTWQDEEDVEASWRPSLSNLTEIFEHLTFLNDGGAVGHRQLQQFAEYTLQRELALYRLGLRWVFVGKGSVLLVVPLSRGGGLTD